MTESAPSAARSGEPIESGRFATGQFGFGQWEILERIASGASLSELLLSIVSLVEHQAEGMLCSILVLDRQALQLRHGASRRLVPELRQYIDGMPIGHDAGSCGAAAFRRERVIVTDIEAHPYWLKYRQPFLDQGLVACWSTPILSPGSDVLGTLAMYFLDKRGPTPEECAWVDAATHLASIALTRAEAEREHERVLHDLRDANQRLTFHVSQMPLGYIVWDRDLTVREWNGAAERIFGWSAQEAIGRRWNELSVFSGPDALSDPLCEEVLKSDAGGARGTHENVRKDGQRLVCDWFHAPLRDSSNQVVGYLSMAHDVTDRQRAEEERQKLEGELRQAQRIQSLGTLAGGIAHDFNNILTAITGHAFLALTDIEEERSTKDSLLAIQEAGLRAVELVRRILTFSRHQEPERKVGSLGPVVLEALRSLRATLSPQIVIRSQLDPESPLVYVDPAQMHQVIMNLGNNAAYALGERGAIDVTVEPVPRSHDDLIGVGNPSCERYVRLSVADTGCGMDPATAERIFEPFFTTKPTGQGTGLGLSVVHGIVKSHDGVISVTSKPGRGSRFNIYLPEARVEAPEQAPLPRAAPALGRGVRVLYVDDEEPLVVLATRWLSRLGYDVTGFSDSSQALEAFRSRPYDFDAVISDFSMPGVSGLTLVREIMALRKDIVVVMSSGYLRPEDQRLATELGAAEVVLKPQSMAEFGRILHRILTERAQPR